MLFRSVIAARVEAALVAAGLLRLPRRDGWDSPGSLRSPSARDRARRSRLYLPGNQPEFPVNVGLFGADCVLMDLEDSVAIDRKAEARILVRRLLGSQGGFFGASEIAVRVNPLAGPFGLSDLDEIVGARPQALVLPKCESATDIEDWDREVGRLEIESALPRGFVLFMPIVETARGVASAVAIAAASPRNVALCFGAEDFRRDLGVERGGEEEEISVARSLVVLAARAAGIEAQDSVYSGVDDPGGLEASSRRAKSLGFSGRGLIHPSQIVIVHRVFSPSMEELARAHRVVETLEKAESEGRGAVSLDGVMIDAPVAARARRVIALAGGQDHDGL